MKASGNPQRIHIIRKSLIPQDKDDSTGRQRSRSRGRHEKDDEVDSNADTIPEIN